LIDNSTATIDPKYFYDNINEPEDIKWGKTMGFVPSSTPHMIQLVGLQLNSKGIVHATAIKPGLRKLYYTTQKAPSSSVRYLEAVDDPDEQMMIDLAFLQNSGEDIFHNPNERYLQTLDNIRCMTTPLNELTITCSGYEIRATSSQREDVAGYYTPGHPSSYTLARESDGQGFKGDGVGRAYLPV
jgi:hypothetical protein